MSEDCESYLPRPPLARMRDENERLTAKVSQLQSELAASLGREEALRKEVEQLKEHAGHAPSMDRVRRMHTKMTVADFAQNSPLGHRIYGQDAGEQCYLCAVLDEVDRLKACVIEFEGIIGNALL